MESCNGATSDVAVEGGEPYVLPHTPVDQDKDSTPAGLQERGTPQQDETSAGPSEEDSPGPATFVPVKPNETNTSRQMVPLSQAEQLAMIKTKQEHSTAEKTSEKLMQHSSSQSNVLLDHMEGRDERDLQFKETESEGREREWEGREREKGTMERFYERLLEQSERQFSDLRNALKERTHVIRDLASSLLLYNATGGRGGRVGKRKRLHARSSLSSGLSTSRFQSDLIRIDPPAAATGPLTLIPAMTAQPSTSSLGVVNTTSPQAQNSGMQWPQASCLMERS